MARRPRSKFARVVRLAALVPLGLVLGLALYVGLIFVGVVRGPLDPLLGGDIALANSDRAGMRVLFVGNSLTFENSMPALVRELADGDEGGPPIFAVQYVAGGWTLGKAARDRPLGGVIDALPWDVVVLQENSLVASDPAQRWRRGSFGPSARALHARIQATGARTLLFMTWGYRDGNDWDYADDSYEAMQARFAEGYREVGAALGVPVVPVGLAWDEALRRVHGLDLWAGDGRHPSRLGSYLAACVFYAVLTGRDPRRSEFRAGLTEGEARFLQGVAADVA